MGMQKLPMPVGLADGPVMWGLIGMLTMTEDGHAGLVGCHLGHASATFGGLI
jgi:hypothetical protein